MTEPLPPHGWLVIACKGGHEERAKRELAKQGFEVWLPLFTARRVNRGTVYLRKEPLFAGYVFVAKVEDTSLSAVSSTRGVIEIIPEAHGGSEWRPALIGHPHKLAMERFCAELAEREPDNPVLRFEPGAEADILEGPFAGKRGTIARLYVVAPQERVTLLLDICGGRVPLSLPAAHVAQTATDMGGGSVP